MITVFIVKKVNRKEAEKADIFRRFAEEKLRYHLAELKVIYRRAQMEPGDKTLVEHIKIYNRELDDEVNKLMGNEIDPEQKEQLKNLKDWFLLKLEPGSTGDPLNP